jgi:ABC-type phosphate transport system substrate-binding protein
MKTTVKRLTFFALVATMLGLAGKARADAPPAAFVLIVNAGVKAQTLTKADVRAMFAKKTTRWADDMLVTPFDLIPASPVRSAFSEAIFNKSPQTVLSEWRQRIFTGQGTPPREVKDDASMIATVAATPGALGYVTAHTPLPPQVHAITISE